MIHAPEMTRYLLLVICVVALLVASCTRGRGREPQNTPPPPPAPASPADVKAAPTGVVQITDASYEQVVHSQKVVLILFWAPWSAPDRAMMPVINALSLQYLGRVKVGRVNVDENPDIARKFGIKGIPTVVVLKDGSEQERVVGVAPESRFTAILDQQLTK